MTAAELEGLYFLRKEIARDRRRICELRERAASTGAAPGRMWGPHAGVSDRVGCCAADIADLTKALTVNCDRAVKKEAEITGFINSVDDPRMRLILKLRFVDCLPWFKVAMELGGGNSDASCKMSFRRWAKTNLD